MTYECNLFPFSCRCIDPKLPTRIYDFVLQKMFQEIESMVGNNTNPENAQLFLNETAISSFLKLFRTWGPISSLKERMKFHDLQSKHLWEVKRDNNEEGEECNLQRTYLSDAESSLSR